jgi:hypothetical protein
MESLLLGRLHILGHLKICKTEGSVGEPWSPEDVARMTKVFAETTSFSPYTYRPQVSYYRTVLCIRTVNYTLYSPFLTPLFFGYTSVRIYLAPILNVVLSIVS